MNNLSANECRMQRVQGTKGREESKVDLLL